MPDLASSCLLDKDPRSLLGHKNVDEMPDLAFLSSWNQEVEVTRCRIYTTPSCLLGLKKSS